MDSKRKSTPFGRKTLQSISQADPTPMSGAGGGAFLADRLRRVPSEDEALQVLAQKSQEEELSWKEILNLRPVSSVRRAITDSS